MSGGKWHCAERRPCCCHTLLWTVKLLRSQYSPLSVLRGEEDEEKEEGEIHEMTYYFVSAGSPLSGRASERNTTNRLMSRHSLLFSFHPASFVPRENRNEIPVGWTAPCSMEAAPIAPRPARLY